MFRAPATCFPSEAEVGIEVIRVHELQAREIPLLWRSSSAIWPATAPMRSMRPYLDCSSQAARPSTASHGAFGSPQSSGEGLYGWPAFLEKMRSRPAGVPISLPASASSFCRSAQPATNPCWGSYPSGRRPVVRVRGCAMGAVPDSAQAMRRKPSHFPRSAALAWQGGCGELASGSRRPPRGRDATYPGDSCRQSSGNAAAREGAGMGSPALSFPPASEVAGLSPRRSLQAARRCDTGGDP